MAIADPSLLWLIAGTSLCLLELIIPTALIAIFLGCGAFIMAVLALVLPHWLGLQIAIWIVCSALVAWLSHRLMPSKSAIDFTQTEAQALTRILPDRPGRVLYEGSSWRARCGDGVSEIEPHQHLHVIGREGTTLLVVPMYALNTQQDLEL